MRKNRHTGFWRVDFENLAYDGGGSASWTQYYWTKMGARISKFWHLHIASWGGRARLSKVVNSYYIKIIRRDGGGQTKDDSHATVTRLSDDKQLIFISDYKWWLKKVVLRPRRIDAAFKRADALEERLAKIEEFAR